MNYTTLSDVCQSDQIVAAALTNENELAFSFLPLIVTRLHLYDPIKLSYTPILT